MNKVDMGGCTYIGAEVVQALVAKNTSQFAKTGRYFIFADITKDDLPKADLVMCRDCLIHLSFKDAKAALRNIRRSGAKYLLVTTDTSVDANRPICTGEFRSLNLQLPPFSLPPPIEIHRDRYAPGPNEKLIDPHKHIALFELNR
jgi:hypothetical protein